MIGFEFDEETKTNYRFAGIYDCMAIFWSARCQPRFGIVLKRCLHTALRKTLSVKKVQTNAEDLIILRTIANIKRIWK